MTTLGRLKFGRERIARGHCKGPLAKAKNGNECLPGHPNASSWCVIGALCGHGLFTHPQEWEETKARLKDALPWWARMLYCGSIVGFSEGMFGNQERLLRLFDAAIEAEERTGLLQSLNSK